MRPRRVRGVWLLLAGLAAAGCEEHEFHPPDRGEQVAEADSLYSQIRFDTITWVSDATRTEVGNTAFAAHCTRCHGPLGRGGTPYAAEQGLEVPSLVEPDWAYAGDAEAVRRRTYVGHPQGMPTWGVGRMTLREVDAVAHYIVDQLRPEVLGTGG